MFIGPAETFGEHEVKLEAHLLDVEMDLYDQEICVELLQKTREHIVFSSSEELVAAITNDISTIRQCLQE